MQSIDQHKHSWLHPDYRKAMRNMAAFLLLLAVIQLVAWLLPTRSDFKGIPYYLPLHVLMETTSIVISMMVFAVGWNSHSRSLSGNVVLLASVFFSVGVLDFLHTVSYSGMPDFISFNDAQKQLNFWLSARLFAALVLLVVAIRPWKPLAAGLTRYLIFGSLLGVTLLINWAVIYHQAWFPDTFIPGQGLTTFKKTFEYLIIVINVITALMLLAMMRERQTFNIVLLFGAVCTLAMSEFYFTLYTTMSGSYNVLGHIYKVIAYLLIYRAIVVEVIEEPYKLLEQAMERFRILFDSAKDCLMLLSIDGRIVDVNPNGHQRLGYTKEEMLGRSISEFDSPEFAAKVPERVAELKHSGHSTFESVHLCKDGALMPVEISSSLIELNGEKLLYSVIRDITERKQIETKILAKELQYEAAIETSVDGFWVVNTQGYLLEVNNAYIQLSGYSRKELLNMSIPELDTQFNFEAMVARMEVIRKEGHVRFESTHKRKDGSIWPVQVVTTYSQMAGGCFFAFLTDITERKDAEALILNHANYDQLTQLPNRRLFQDRLEQEFKKTQREQYSTALLFIDLDRFKEVNDTLGHDVGDLLLIDAAKRVKSCVRDYDTVARLGGDEFTVILSELKDVSDIGHIAQNIINSLSKSFLIRERESFVSASIGIALYPEDATNVNDLLKNADQAMYQAKQNGRGRFHFFTRAMQEVSETRMQLANDLRSALGQGQLEVYYQPIVDLTDGSISKAEALLRWNHPEHGQVSPATFIPIAEDTGTIHEIGYWVFKQAAMQAKKLTMALGSEFQISVNKSPVQFDDNEGPYPRWTDQLKEMGLAGSSIVVEITEGLLMKDNPRITERLLQFRDAGIQVSIDDFGTGYSALSYLKKFDIDFLKIDQSFTQNLAPEAEDFALCEAIVVMAHKLGIKVIAEGVETEQQRDLLRQMGCDYGQGYLFSRPVPVNLFEAILK